MELLIDTSKNEYIYIAILKSGDVVFEKRLEAKYRQSEKLLPAIHDLLQEGKINIKNIKKIKVNSKGEGFSSLRIGVVTANALAYALGVPCKSFDNTALKTKKFSLVEPEYNQEPNIG